MIVAQISDFHAVPPGERMGGTLDTNSMLRAAVAELQNLTPRPDVVIATGDLTNAGDRSAYGVVRSLLDELDAPTYVIPGNHDNRQHTRETFSDSGYMPRDGFIQYAVEDSRLRILALDTLIDGENGGTLCHERLDWLDKELAREPDAPTLIAMHHPPIRTGIEWMDEQGLQEPDSLANVVRRHPQIAGIACGHLHRTIHAPWAGTVVSIGPSTSFQVGLDLGPGSPPRPTLEVPAYNLHYWNGQALVTHTKTVASEGSRGTAEPTPAGSRE